jgi:hypothetical protein
MLHEQAAPAVTSMLSSSTARRCHTSVLLQEQRDETGPPAHIFKKDATSWVSLLFYIIMTYRLVYLKCLCILNLGLSIDFFKFFLLLSFWLSEWFYFIYFFILNNTSSKIFSSVPHSLESAYWPCYHCCEIPVDHCFSCFKHVFYFIFLYNLN